MGLLFSRDCCVSSVSVFVSVSCGGAGSDFLYHFFLRFFRTVLILLEGRLVSLAIDRRARHHADARAGLVSLAIYRRARHHADANTDFCAIRWELR